jgi:hypothetical protein
MAAYVTTEKRGIQLQTAIDDHSVLPTKQKRGEGVNESRSRLGVLDFPGFDLCKAYRMSPLIIALNGFGC